MIDRTKYLACNMARLANDCSFTQIESLLGYKIKIINDKESE